MKCFLMFSFSDGNDDCAVIDYIHTICLYCTAVTDGVRNCVNYVVLLFAYDIIA